MNPETQFTLWELLRTAQRARNLAAKLSAEQRKNPNTETTAAAIAAHNEACAAVDAYNTARADAV